MDSGRFETFIDAILAIMMTVMILKIPQPTSPSLNALWDLRVMYFVYFLSFMVIASIWNQHRKLFNRIKNINNKVILVYMILTFFITLVPYFTIWVANNPMSLFTELCYGFLYILINLLYNFAAFIAIYNDKFNEIGNFFKMTVVNKLNTLIFILAFIIGILYYPPSVLIGCFLTFIMWNIPQCLFSKGDADGY